MASTFITLLVPTQMRERCFAAADLARLAAAGTLVFPSADESRELPAFWASHAAKTHVLLTGWGTPPLTEAMLAAALHLRAVIHAAGSVKQLLPTSLWTTHIPVASCNRELAIGVAETNLGLIIAGLKGFFPCAALTRQGRWKHNDTDIIGTTVREMYQNSIGIIGASQVGRHTIHLLRQFEVQVMLTDPYVQPDEARQLGVELLPLDELMRRSQVVCLAAPALPSTRHMLGAAQFKLMPDGAIFINTARGMIVDEVALAAELRSGRIWAFLDVTDPEPPAVDHPFRQLPNVVLLPHIAGCVGNGCLRLGRGAVDQALDFLAGRAMSGLIPVHRLAQMA